MADILSTERNYRSLSIKDLLQARDLYHYHLLNKPNVIGTAVGLYLIRKSDPHAGDRPSKSKAPTAFKSEPKTFENTEVRRYSWPCLIAVVREWCTQSPKAKGSKRLRPDDIVPQTLY